MVHQIAVYTDGSASTITRCGGYAAIVSLSAKETYILYGAEVDTTISRMEMMAVNAALDLVKTTIRERNMLERDIKVYCDSQFLVQCARGIFRRKANPDLWKRFEAVSVSGIEFIHIPRNSMPEQELCDGIAGKAREKAETEKASLPLKIKQVKHNENTSDSGLAAGSQEVPKDQ